MSPTIRIADPEGALREEAAHAAAYIVHGHYPKEVVVNADGTSFCDYGVSPLRESFLLKVKIPGTLVGPMMRGRRDLRVKLRNGEYADLSEYVDQTPWPPTFEQLDANHPSSSDMRICASVAQQLDWTEATWNRVVARAQALTENEDFLAIWRSLMEHLRQERRLTKPQLEKLFPKGAQHGH